MSKPISDPPAIVREVDICDEHLVRAFGLDDRIGADWMDMCAELVAAKESCPKGQWEKRVEKYGRHPRTVRRMMDKYREVTGTSRNAKSLIKANVSFMRDVECMPEDAEPETTSGEPPPASPQKPAPAGPVLCHSCAHRKTLLRPPVKDCPNCADLRAARVGAPPTPPKPAVTPQKPTPPATEPPPVESKAEDAPDDPPEEEVITDAEGHPVPAHAREAFATADEITGVCRDHDEMLRTVEAIAKTPGGRLIRFDSYKQQIKDAKGNLWANRLTHLCPYCEGVTKKPVCDACKGVGLVAKHIWEQAPGVRERNGK